MKEVAALAGVPVATVSRALAGSPLVTVETREAVEKAVRQAGYTINQAGRGLRLQVSHRILVLLPTLSNPFFAEIVQALDEKAQRSGFSVLVGSTEGSLEREDRLARQLQSGAADLPGARSPGACRARCGAERAAHRGHGCGIRAGPRHDDSVGRHRQQERGAGCHPTPDRARPSTDCPHRRSPRQHSHPPAHRGSSCRAPRARIAIRSQISSSAATSPLKPEAGPCRCCCSARPGRPPSSAQTTTPRSEPSPWQNRQASRSRRSLGGRLRRYRLRRLLRSAADDDPPATPTRSTSSPLQSCSVRCRKRGTVTLPYEMVLRRSTTAPPRRR